MVNRKEIELRVLTWRQPYATLMLPPFNKIETRTWQTKYRGWVAIHAAKTVYSTSQLKEIAGNQYERLMDTITDHDFHKGSIIAVGYLTDCRRMLPEDADKSFVEYRPHLWCHIYEKVIEINPIPFKGQQGWARMTQGFIRENIPLKLLKVTPKKQLSLF